MRNEKRELWGACAAEATGAFFLVLFGTGAVHVAVLTGALAGLYQVAIVWGLVIALGIYTAGALSGAHFNPAVTVAFWAWRGFPGRRVAPYILAQLAGAFLAAAALYLLFRGLITGFEAAQGIVRGAPGSERTAMCFGEYFPHPWQVGVDADAFARVGPGVAMCAEALGTGVLVFFIFALTDERNPGRPTGPFVGLFIGLTVTILICLIAPLTQAGFNPARDFGPRLFAWMAGWGDIAIPGPRGGFFTVYILSPILGGLAGGGAYDLLIRRHLPHPSQLQERTMSKPVVLLLGGFLGAGKTTLMAAAAERLTRRGRKVGLVTNDQAADMVDTRFLEQRGFAVREVAGSCFCCNFDGLVAALDSLRESGAEIILAEAVGSCTDLSATIMQPLKDRLGTAYETRPSCVLVDPARLAEVVPEAAPAGPKRADLHPSAAYIIEKQMEEADFLLLNKTDTVSRAEREALLALLGRRYPQARLFALSATEGAGVDEWLEAALSDRSAAGRRIAEVDYDTYAEGEALLGWLNARISLKARTPAPWRDLCEGLVRSLGAHLEEHRLYSGHVKAVITDGAAGAALCNLPHTGASPLTRGEIDAQAGEAALLVNARVAMPPEALERLVRDKLAAVCGRFDVAAAVESLNSLSPGRPRPTWRYDRVV